jgi:hypothetical protein
MDTTNEPVWTMPIVEAGKRYFNLGRSASYRAADTGAIPTVRVNGKVFALPRIIEAQLQPPRTAAGAAPDSDKAA